jgi:hypothetical protein
MPGRGYDPSETSLRGAHEYRAVTLCFQNFWGGQVTTVHETERSNEGRGSTQAR